MTKTCKHCGTAFERPRRISAAQWEQREYCSKVCASRASGTARRIEVQCRRCGAQFWRRDASQVFCSRRCATEERTEKWRQPDPGTLRAVRKNNESRALRRLALVGYYPARCEICGFKRYVEYAHIIPRSQGGTAEAWNILALCPNHHRLFDRADLSQKELGTIRERLIEALRIFADRGGLPEKVTTPSVRYEKGGVPLLRLVSS